MKQKRKYETRVCLMCGKEYSARTDSKNMYCSCKCAGRARTERSKKYAQCPVCGEIFLQKRKERIYCSSECRTKDRLKRLTLVCDECGEKFERVECHVRGKHNFCSKECYNKWMQSKAPDGEQSPRWKGGVSMQNDYIFLREDKRKYRAEHRIIVENYLGRKLESNEIVHHLDGNKLNNEISNLMIVTRAEHARIHAQMRRENRRKQNELYENA